MTLHHVERGAGPALLLGGSLGTTHALWDRHVELLSDTHRVVAFDHRGHGRSPVPPGPYRIADLGRDVLALADALRIDRFAYAGVSIGGMVGLWLGAHASERLTRLVLIDTSARVDAPEAFLARARTVRDEQSARALAEPVVDRWVTAAFAQAHPEVVACLRSMVAQSPAEGYAACCEAIASHDLRDALTSIDVATTVIHAREDEAIPFAHGEQLAATIPGARLRAISPGGHIPTIEYPEETAEMIREAIA